MNRRSARSFVHAAVQHMEDRSTQYDKPSGERSMAQAVSAFNAITRRDLLECEGWLLLQILKDVRAFTNHSRPHVDSLEDAVAYAALKAESFNIASVVHPLATSNGLSPEEYETLVGHKL